MALSRTELGSGYPLTPEEMLKLRMKKMVHPTPEVTESEKDKGVKSDGKEEGLGKSIDIKV